MTNSDLGCIFKHYFPWRLLGERASSWSGVQSRYRVIPDSQRATKDVAGFIWKRIQPAKNGTIQITPLCAIYSMHTESITSSKKALLLCESIYRTCPAQANLQWDIMAPWGWKEATRNECWWLQFLLEKWKHPHTVMMMTVKVNILQTIKDLIQMNFTVYKLHSVKLQGGNRISTD